MLYPDWSKRYYILKFASASISSCNSSIIEVKEDGYALITSGAYRTSCSVYLNGMDVTTARTQSSGSHDYDCNFIPVKKGDKLQARGSAIMPDASDCNRNATVLFLPFKH